MRLRVESPDGSGLRTKIFLDDVEIRDAVSIRLRADVGGIWQVELELFVRLEIVLHGLTADQLTVRDTAGDEFVPGSPARRLLTEWSVNT